jgi:hypothetical protein
MNIKYLVTTDSNLVPSDVTVIQVDGSIPGVDWAAHTFDHHREGGAEIQVDELPDSSDPACSWIEWHYGNAPVCIATTRVDADACVAAAYLQLPACVAEANLELLRAIAYDCDHLAVPARMRHTADFAAQNVAALKQSGFRIADEMGFPKDRRAWSAEQYSECASAAFKQGTEMLINACLGKAPFPSELEDTAKYFQGITEDAKEILDKDLISIVQGCAVFDLRGFTRYVDPRAPLKALNDLLDDNCIRGYGYLSTHPWTLTRRNHKSGEGFSYTLGVVPFHPQIAEVDYMPVYQALTALEEKSSDPWSGRKTVGGSGWNSPSGLEPEQVITCLFAVNTKEQLRLAALEFVKAKVESDAERASQALRTACLSTFKSCLAALKQAARSNILVEIEGKRWLVDKEGATEIEG